MYKVTVNGKEYTVDINNQKVMVNDHEFEMQLKKSANGQTQVIMPNKVLYPVIEKTDNPKNNKIKLGGQAYQVELKDHFDLLLEKLGMDKMMTTVQSELKAPMPGLVLEIMCKKGDVVKKGDALLVLEAMKMENVIKAASDGTVKDIKVAPKQAVEKNTVLITFE